VSHLARAPAEGRAPRGVDLLVAVSVLFAVVWGLFGTANNLSRGVVGVERENGEVVSLAAGTPAESSDLRVGDRVQRVEDAEGLVPAGRTVTYVVERDGITRRIEIRAAPLTGAPRMALIATTVMGLIFLVCGGVVFGVRRDAAGALFALSCSATAVHWGGFPATGSDLLLRASLMVLMLATGLEASFLLHFALRFPARCRLLERSSTRWWLYGPVLLELLLAPTGIALMAAASEASTPVQTVFFLLVNVHAYLYTLLVLITLVVRFRRMDATDRRDSGVGLMILGLLGATIPYLAALVLEAAGVELPGGLGSYPFTLFFTLIPLSFGVALLRAHRGERMRVA
jgi:hypothetical protein